MMTKVLIIDDNIGEAELLKMYLQNEGFEIQVARNWPDGKKLLHNFDPEVILMDVCVPDKRTDGWQFIRETRDTKEFSDVVIIVITAKGDVIDKVLGLELGADDYMVKPVDVKEVHARIKAILRRTRKEDPEGKDTVKYENLEISLARYELKVNNKTVDLPPKELELLYFLASNCNRVYTRDQLLDKVWSFDYLGDSRTVDVHIKRLREKLMGVSDKWAIETVWGVGYKFKVYTE